MPSFYSKFCFAVHHHFIIHRWPTGWMDSVRVTVWYDLIYEFCVHFGSLTKIRYWLWVMMTHWHIYNSLSSNYDESVNSINLPAELVPRSAHFKRPFQFLTWNFILFLGIKWMLLSPWKLLTWQAALVASQKKTISVFGGTNLEWKIGIGSRIWLVSSPPA